MRVNLDSMSYYFLTTGTNEKRKTHMLELLKNYNATEVNPVMGIDKLQSGATGIARCIDLGLRDQDRTKKFQPFMILEDDVSFYGEYPSEIEIPDNSDLFYTGISRYGNTHIVPNKLKFWEKISAKDNIMATDVNPDTVRLYNMLALHSVLICSPSGALAYQKGVMEGYFKKIPWDVNISALQPYYNVYAFKSPLFYQNSEFGGQEEPTNFILTEYSNPSKLNHTDVSILMAYKR